MSTQGVVSISGTAHAAPDGSNHSQAVSSSPDDGLIETYRRSLESSPIGLLTIDEAGTIVFANRHLEQLFGYGPGELVGAMVDILVPERFRSRHPQLRGGYLEAPSPRAMGDGTQLSGVRKDGSEFSVEIGLRPLILDEGRLVVASVVDTTKRQQQEAELQARVIELQEHHTQIELLGEMNSLLQHATCKEEAVEVTYLLGKRLFGDAEVALYSFSPSRDGLTLQATWGDWQPDVRMEPHSCWAVRRSQTYTNRSHSVPYCSHFRDGGAVTICIPMSAHGTSVGLIAMRLHSGDDKEVRRAITAGQSVADQLALALSNIQLRDELRNLAIRDPLTNLFNRRYLEESINREMQRAQRRNSPVAGVMLDIDDFKVFNDTRGHQAADEVLQSVGSVLLKGIRGEDIACRYGGEEFLLALPDCSFEDALRRTDHVRRSIEGLRLGVTISAGVAEWPRHGRDWTTVVKQADMALYEAKRSGKNRVMGCEDLGSPT